MPQAIPCRSPAGASRTAQALALCALHLAACSQLLGCRTQAVRAAKLPPEYRAAARSNDSALKLAQISLGGPASSLISPGDLLDVTVASGLETDARPLPTRVADDGSIEIPPVGNVRVAGLEPQTAAALVTRAAIDRGIYVRPHVSVEIASKAVNQVTVLGAVASPGLQKLPKNSSDLVNALAAAGGLTDEAGVEVEIIRPAPWGAALAGSPPEDPSSATVQLASHQGPGSETTQTLRINLAEEGGSVAEQCALSDRDIVMVRPREKDVVFVGGLVNKAGQYEMPRDQDVRLLDAIMMGGGQSSPVADKVLVLRQLPDRSSPITIQASLQKAKQNGQENLRIAPGDTVIVEQTPATAVVEAMTRLLRFTFGVASQATIF